MGWFSHQFPTSIVFTFPFASDPTEIFSVSWFIQAFRKSSNDILVRRLRRKVWSIISCMMRHLPPRFAITAYCSFSFLSQGSITSSFARSICRTAYRSAILPFSKMLSLIPNSGSVKIEKITSSGTPALTKWQRASNTQMERLLSPSLGSSGSFPCTSMTFTRSDTPQRSSSLMSFTVSDIAADVDTRSRSSKTVGF